MNDTLRTKFQRAMEAVFSVVVGAPKFIRDVSIAMLFEGPVLFVGPPGIGKTTLARALGRALFGSETAVVTCYQEAMAEDVLFEVEMAQEHGERQSRYISNVRPRRIMTLPIALMNEVNRLCPATANTLMGLLAEGFIEVRGVRLTKERGKLLADMNEHAGDLEEALKDRFVAAIAVQQLDIDGQAELVSRSIKGAAGHAGDLVSSLDAVLSPEEMFDIWADVQKVSIPARAQMELLLAVNLFASCKHPLGSASIPFKDRLDCGDCTYRRTCVTRMLETPLLHRLLEAVALVARASAWFAGRAEVQLDPDILTALRLCTAHRVRLQDEDAANYLNVTDWFDRVVTPIVRGRQQEWVRATAAYRDVVQALRNNDPRAGGRVANAFIRSSRDITTVNLVRSVAEKHLGPAAEQAHATAMAAIESMVSGQTVYSAKELTEMGKALDWLPESRRRDVEVHLEMLRERLRCAVELDPTGFTALVGELGKLDSTIVRKLARPTAKMNHVFPNSLGTITVMPPTNGSTDYEVTCEATSSELSEVLVRHGAI